MEVRFTIKGQELCFIPVSAEDGKVYLYAENHDADSNKIKLDLDESTHVFKLEDYSIFEEPKEIIEERLLGLSEEWMESNVIGFDSVSSSPSPAEKPGYSADDIFVENKPFSLKQLVDLIDSGDIEMDPSFQRNFIWDNTRQSRLIESIILGLPLPSIYLSQYDDGTLTIVDGLQRLNTIRKFVKDELVLSNLEYLNDCNGKKYSQLTQVLSPLRVRRFGQTQIMCFVIDYRSPNRLKYDLFRRLNTGGKPLNNQEIRNCLSRPALQRALKQMVGSEAYLTATGGSVKDIRMDAQESALRYMYFCDQYRENNVIGNYSGNIDATLDEYVEKMNQVTDFDKYIRGYEQSMKDASVLFGKYAFRKLSNDYDSAPRRSQVNKLLMMSICVLLTKFRDAYAEGIESKIDLTPYLACLIEEDPMLFDAITWSTNSKWNVEYVLNTLKSELFDKYLLNHE